MAPRLHLRPPRLGVPDNEGADGAKVKPPFAFSDASSGESPMFSTLYGYSSTVDLSDAVRLVDGRKLLSVRFSPSSSPSLLEGLIPTRYSTKPRKVSADKSIRRGMRPLMGSLSFSEVMT